MSAETLAAEALTVSGYLEFEEKLDETETDPWTLEVDLAPFNANVPKIQRCTLSIPTFLAPFRSTECSQVDGPFKMLAHTTLSKPVARP